MDNCDPSYRVLTVLFEERLGGPQLRVLQVARELRPRGIETVIVIPRGEPKFANMLRADRFHCIELDLARLRNTVHPAAHWRWLRSFWRNVRELRDIIRNEQIRIVQVNGLMNLQPALAARREGVPLFWYLNDTLSPWLLRRIITPLISRWASAITVEADAVRHFYFPGSTDRRICLLYAPVDTSRFHPGEDRSGIRKELGIPASSTIVVTVANLHPAKGVHHLIEAMPEVLREFPDIHFLVVGATLENRHSYAEGLARRAAELHLDGRLHFVPHRLDIPDVLRASSIMVHPSESEACPMAVLEGSASGLPLIATGVGGTRELVQDGVTGIIIDAGSSEQISSALLRLLRDPCDASRLGKAGAKLMGDVFSLERCVRKHEQIYRHAFRGSTESPVLTQQ